MSKNVSRRDFLKLASVGAATTAVLTGCGPASRYVTREPYTKMPEYTYNGLSTYYATTCRECAAACGLIVRTMQGRAIKVEGNPENPINRGKTCSRGQVSLQGLYNPNRIRGPLQHKRGEALYSETFQDVQSNMNWDDAVQVVADALKDSSGVAFLMGTTSDHLFDLVSELAGKISAAAPVRFSASSMFDTQATLSQAAKNVLGQAGLPLFDISTADLVISFGANFLETWLSPVAYNVAFGKMRKGDPKHRGYFVQFESRLSQTAAKSDEWIPVCPGTEGLVALALGRLVAEAGGGAIPAFFNSVDVDAVASAADVSRETLEHIAQLVVDAASPIAIPGGQALGQSNGLSVAESILAFNAFTGNVGKAGGVLLTPFAPNQDQYHRPLSAQELSDFIAKMKSGAIKTLFIHGVNPVFDAPKSLGFEEALKSVGKVISFANFPDETAVQSDYVFPDHHGLEAWGYQRGSGTSQSVLSGLQPVVSPFYDTRATADVFIAAAALPFQDEVEYIQGKLVNLIPETDGSFVAPEINTFAAYFQQHGGWWKKAPEFASVSISGALSKKLDINSAEFAGEGEFVFLPFVSPTLGENGANKPWLQELADPMTTVMWNTWVEINPETAHELGVDNDDVVKIVSEFGEVEAPVYLYPGIRPDVIAMPYGQGHTAYGRYAQGRGANPVNILGAHFNEAGDLAFAGMKVKVEKTGRKQPLSRLESRIGVYGEGMGEGH